MDFSVDTRSSQISTFGWRLLLLSALTGLVVQLLASGYYSTGFVTSIAISLTLFDLVRLVRRSKSSSRDAGVAQARDQARLIDQMQALLDAVTVALFTLTPDGRIRFVNRAGRLLAGTNAARIEDIPSLGAEAAAIIHTLPPGGRQIVPIADGRSVLVWVGSFSAPGLGVQRLVSLQSLARELDAVQVAAWHSMTRILSHEIMNSLTPIASLAESLSRLVGGMTDVAPEAERAVATIARRAQHLMSFVERYRLIVDLPEPQLSDIDVARFMADTEVLMGTQLRARGITFSAASVATGWRTRFDADLLSQAITNLIHNAADAAAGTDDAKVSLSCVRDRSTISFLVTDNGSGVSHERIEEIFVPFFTTKPGGSGIGLALSRQIALAHGGRLIAMPNAERGMTFTLSIPADA